MSARLSDAQRRALLLFADPYAETGGFFGYGGGPTTPTVVALAARGYVTHSRVGSRGWWGLAVLTPAGRAVVATLREAAEARS